MLAAAPQRVDPTKRVPADPASLFDWQKSLYVVFDGTGRAPMGRQLFVPPEVRQAPAPVATVMRPLGRAEQRAYDVLRQGDSTAAALRQRLRISTRDAQNVLTRLMRRGMVTVVGLADVQTAAPGQHTTARLYGVVRS
jgi:hypothetical protein